LLPKWERIVGYSRNYKQNYTDEFTFLAHGIDNETPAIIKDLRNNRVGYIVEILTTGNQSYVFQSPVFLNEANTKQIDSHSWQVSLAYRIPSFLNKLTLLSTILSNESQVLSTDREIIGVQKIALYVNEDVVYRYLDISNENEVALVSPVDPFIIINDVNQLPKWERTTDNSGNYKQDYNDEFSFLLHGIENDVPEIIQSLRNNRAGFIAEILTTGNKPFIFRTPVFLNTDNTKQIDSHSWQVSLSYRIPSFEDKLTLTERPIVEYRNGIVTNSFFGQVAVFDFEAKIGSNTQVTFTVNWGAEVGTTVINSTLVNGIWKALQTSILIPFGVDPNQTILVTDNFGDSFEIDYIIEEIVPLNGLIAHWEGGSVINIAPGFEGVYDGTLSASPPTLVNGINGEANGAFNFVSANLQEIIFGSIAELKNVQKFSISTWFNKLNANTLHLGDVITNVQFGTFLQWVATTNQVFAASRNGDTSSRNTVQATGDFINVIGVFDGTQAVNLDRWTMYVNGVSTGTPQTPFPANTPNNSDPFIMGRVLAAAFGDGQIAQTLIYNRVLTAADAIKINAQKTT
ncbi:LamG domain-containing protein, partial [Candidatus Pacearchaeota archaeon]|nr:LamG domain-containing protein [Candidatus Pacearchaeota archaeon]